MMSSTAASNATILENGVELTDIRIGASQRALFFHLAVPDPARVTLRFQELNTASRCMLLASPTDPTHRRDGHMALDVAAPGEAVHFASGGRALPARLSVL
ncbi:hypothetical protein STCU_11650 [Strigomonas culicis]|uniref:Uncharacterized protein n=1 Tax=Strigomonas culicis TaxID=28005 RepID=S9TD49_9TRYP|nr:hypothetical protein STCU_11650 [Strigomonas culicis]|eukprot:EPY15952.1 hypothetical protein STCU_11650 [Strigomonas culicis]